VRDCAASPAAPLAAPAAAGAWGKGSYLCGAANKFCTSLKGSIIAVKPSLIIQDGQLSPSAEPAPAAAAAAAPLPALVCHWRPPPREIISTFKTADGTRPEGWSHKIRSSKSQLWASEHERAAGDTRPSTAVVGEWYVTGEHPQRQASSCRCGCKTLPACDARGCTAWYTA
jgi:hypothetical protein